jgi:hypothetical protein
VSKRRRVLISLGAVAVVAGLYVWFFGMTTMFAIESRHMGRKFPVLNIVPASLPDSSVSEGPVQKLSYAGYEFEVPWAVDEKKNKQISATSEIVEFASGNALWFSVAPPKEFLHTVLKCTDADESRLRQLYGSAVDSDYAMHKLILEVTPQKIGPLSSRRQAAGGMMLLLYKGITVSRGGETGIFQVRTSNYEGFEYGDPLRRPRSIDVEMFADDGGLAFLFMQNESGPVAAITQAEINRVIQSAHKAPKAG